MHVRKLTTELSYHDIRHLRAALDHARKIWRSLNTYVTWAFYPSALPTPEARSLDTNRFFTHLRTWTQRHFGDFIALWVWHADEKGRSPHLHVLMHLPPRLRGELAKALQEIYPAGAIDVSKGDFIASQHVSGYWGSTFDYITRYMSQRAYWMQNGKRWRASRRDASGKHVGVKAPIEGKRWGCTRNINRNAESRFLTVEIGTARSALIIQANNRAVA